jgi:hypothetical protein
LHPVEKIYNTPVSEEMGRIASSILRSAQPGYRKTRTAANWRPFHDDELGLLAGKSPWRRRQTPTRTLDPKRRFLFVRFAVAKYFIVLGQEGRQLSRILRIGDSQQVSAR